MIRIDEDLSQILQRRWEPPQVFKNAISQEDLHFFLHDEQICPEKKVYPKRTFGVNTWRARQRMMAWLNDNLKYPFKITGGNYFNVEEPHIVHADTGTSSRAALYRIIVIPLAIVKDESKNFSEDDITLTILNQRWYNQAAFFIRGENEDVVNRKKSEYNIPVTDYHDVYLKETTCFPLDTHAHMFSHFQYSHLEGMSILETVKWRPGDIISFDRSNIHVASNFMKFGVKAKIGLTFFLEYDDL